MFHSLISDIGLAILAASLLGFIFHSLKLPLIPSYIVAGVVLGHRMGFGLISQVRNVEMLSEIGFILLMFTLGIEIDLKKLKHASRAVFIAGVIQVVFSFLIIFIFFKLFDMGMGTSKLLPVYIAMAAALSSTIIIVKTLSDRMEMGHLSSRITIGVAIVQDLWAVSFLAFQQSFESVQPMILLTSLGKIALLATTCILISKYVLPKFFTKVDQRPELVIISAIAWCFAMVTLSNSLKLSKEMGALIAGVTIAALPYHAEISSKILNLRDFFMTLFFVALGLRLPAPEIKILYFVLITTVLVYFTRLVSIMSILRYLGYGTRTGFTTSINLSQISEFSLILIALGMQYGHVDSSLLYAFIWAFVLTSVISSVAMQKIDYLNNVLYSALTSLGIKKSDSSQDVIKDATYTITFIGFHQTGSSLLRRIEEHFTKEFAKNIQIIDSNPETLKRLRNQNYTCHYADLAHPNTSLKFSPHKSEIIVSTLPDHLLKGTSNLTLLKFYKKHAPQAHVVTTAETVLQAVEMYQAGASYVLIPRFINADYVSDIFERLRRGDGELIRKNAFEYVSNIKEVIP